MKKFIACILLCTSLVANAGFVTGKTLLDGLTGNEYAKLQATSYVIGAFDAYEGTAHCAPKGVTVKQVIDISQYFLEINPDKLDKPADLILAKLFNTVWPCKKIEKQEPSKDV